MKNLNWFGTPVNRTSLGYHMIAPQLYQDVSQAVIAARPACLKVVADRDEFAMFGTYYNALKDKTVFIARPFTPGELVNQGISYGIPWQTVARDWHDAVLPYVHYLPLAYWEVCNEPAAEMAGQLALVVKECIRLANASGFRVAAPAWSEGRPRMERWGDPVDDWLAFMPALEAINAAGPRGAILTVHEYCRQQDGGFLTQPWRVGRINGVYQEFIDALGLTNIYTVISEYGRDAPKWKEMNLPPEVYANELTSDAVQDMYDARVVGRLIYTLNDVEWPLMDIKGPCFNLVNAYIASHQPSVYPAMPGVPGGTTPPPQPPPPPIEGVFRSVVLYSSNQRAEPTINSTLLGKVAGSTPPAVLDMVYPAVNGYLKAYGQPFWLLAQNVKKL